MTDDNKDKGSPERILDDAKKANQQKDQPVDPRNPSGAPKPEQNR